MMRVRPWVKISTRVHTLQVSGLRVKLLSLHIHTKADTPHWIDVLHSVHEKNLELCSHLILRAKCSNSIPPKLRAGIHHLICAPVLAPGGKACSVSFKILRDWQPLLLAMRELFFSGEICETRATRLINILNYFPSPATANLLSKKLNKRSTLLRSFSSPFQRRPMNNFLN
jgi:hypothetical protein